MSTIADCRARLSGVRPDGNGGLLALCPCHDDHDPSLHLWRDEAGRLAFSCLAGCEWSVVNEKLTEMGLAAEAHGGGDDHGATIVATYDYRDVNGTLVYQVLRYQPKDFRQRRPNGAGGWTWNLKDTPRLLFRLPELIVGVAASETVYVTEGEKDALAIVAAGGIATCNSGGAGKWRAECNSYFAAANVIIVADKDGPGRKHAERVRDNLEPIAATVCIVEAKEGKDAADHLAAGFGLDQFVAVREKRQVEERGHLVAHHCTDSGNAERLIDVFADDIRYCPVWGAWLIWDGCRWAKDDALRIEHLAGLALRAIHHEAAEAESEAKGTQLGKWALTSESAQRRRAAIECARSDPRIVVRPAQLDADPWLFTCLNGTVDLRTGLLRGHERADLITKLAPVKFDPQAELALWDRVLDEATEGSEEMQAFLQRLAGYSLTGVTTEEKLPFIYGPEATAKSTILEALKSAWGDYAQTADFDTFLKRSSVGSPRTDLARLAGARLVISIETEAGKRLADGLVKMITGGDRVVARRLYQDEFEFKPQFTLWWAANDAPRMSDRDGALWRRIVEIPFVHQIPKEGRDPRVKATLTNPALAGPAILAWSVRGCLEWQQEGLGVPPAVEQATEQLRDEMNPLRDFFAERCLFEAKALTPSKTLYAAYRNWGAANNERGLLTRREFGLRIGDRVHCESRHRRDGWWWPGIRLQDASVAQSLDLEPEP
jgi:putative DNA primase/helicase